MTAVGSTRVAATSCTHVTSRHACMHTHAKITADGHHACSPGSAPLRGDQSWGIMWVPIHHGRLQMCVCARHAKGTGARCCHATATVQRYASSGSQHCIVTRNSPGVKGRTHIRIDYPATHDGRLGTRPLSCHRQQHACNKSTASSMRCPEQGISDRLCQECLTPVMPALPSVCP